MQLRILYLLFVLVACTRNQNESSVSKRTETSYAKHLKIQSRGDAYLVTLQNSENKSIHRYWLSKFKPKQLHKDVQFIKVPVRRLVVLSSTHIGMLEKLNALDIVHGVGNVNFIYSNKIKASIDSKKVVVYGDDREISPEKLLLNHPELLVYSGFDGSFPNSNRLEKYGVICMPNFDWKESHPLGKAEWIKLFGCLTGKYENSKRYFDGVVQRYTKFAKESHKDLKKSKLLSGNRIGDVWYCPAGKSYFSKLYQDAGFEYPYSHTPGVGSVSFSFERMVAENRDADIWINPGVPSKRSLISGDSRYRLFKPIQSGEVYCYSHQMNRFWELSAIEPDKVLQDMIRIAKGEANVGLYFYKRIE